jgi:hypothetical protein
MKPSKYIITGHDDLITLLDQISDLNVVSIEHTGVGYICDYKVDDLDFVLNEDDDIIIISGDEVEAAVLPHGAVITLRIYKGAIDSLEIFANDSNFPLIELTEYTFSSPPVNIIEINN